jgi:sulfur relay (sulfurtransferase) complex TusBCD TusD component (DsrE family)
MDALGMDDGQLVEGAQRSDIDELADWTIAADKVLVF